MKILEAEHICKSFGQTEVLKDISFSLEESQVLSIIGSSGSGKTTLLRCLNFLERPDKGIIRVKTKPSLMQQTRQPCRMRKSAKTVCILDSFFSHLISFLNIQR